jgi:hypothetical protein
LSGIEEGKKTKFSSFDVEDAVKREQRLHAPDKCQVAVRSRLDWAGWFQPLRLLGRAASTHLAISMVVGSFCEITRSILVVGLLGFGRGYEPRLHISASRGEGKLCWEEGAQKRSCESCFGYFCYFEYIGLQRPNFIPQTLRFRGGHTNSREV